MQFKLFIEFVRQRYTLPALLHVAVVFQRRIEGVLNVADAWILLTE
jgi:hypothetical protein